MIQGETVEAMPILGREVMEATEGILIRGAADRAFDDISTDTREAQRGKLFIPLRGERFDGHEFLAAAVKNGAAGLIIREGEEGRLWEIGEDITVISVPDTLAALGEVARFWRKKFNIPVIAITGSAGKTTTKEMTAHILGIVKNILKTEGNFNNLVGLPLTLLRLKDEHEAAIIEMGTNVPGEIRKLCRIAAPDVGLITNIGAAHLEGLKSIRMVREEKGEIFRNLSNGGIAVINGDDKEVRTVARRWTGKRMTYGLKGDADVRADEIRSGRQGLSFTLRIGESRGNVDMAVAGTHNVMNALAAAAASRAVGADPETIRRGLMRFKVIPARMETHRLKNGAFLIDDSYNANPLSVREALMTLRSLRGEHKGIVILGDMLELGDRAEELHEEIGGLIAATGVETLFLRGAFSAATLAGAVKKGFPVSRIFYPSTPEEILKVLSSSLKKGDWILVKGSRAKKMEEVIKIIIEEFGLEGGLTNGLHQFGHCYLGG
ncbi:MAG TPA: UDP-N-acetylmuramoyl-tripeptide--D-alanyl-D-alanine ligase [Syntrophales bacterium]|nr:UDP-N-acetylmuramoyl-tripeptide--D-alanyl-D-alanine ligase [Syntrophales bacterium]